MVWCFAIINGRLAEIYFEKKGNNIEFLGHCYVKKEEFTTKREQKQINADIKKYKFSYRNGKYKLIKIR